MIGISVCNSQMLPLCDVHDNIGVFSSLTREISACISRLLPLYNVHDDTGVFPFSQPTIGIGVCNSQTLPLCDVVNNTGVYPSLTGEINACISRLLPLCNVHDNTGAFPFSLLTIGISVSVKRCRFVMCMLTQASFPSLTREVGACCSRLLPLDNVHDNTGVSPR